MDHGERAELCDGFCYLRLGLALGGRCKECHGSGIYGKELECLGPAAADRQTGRTGRTENKLPTVIRANTGVRKLSLGTPTDYSQRP